jgi:hypothetical protein
MIYANIAIGVGAGVACSISVVVRGVIRALNSKQQALHRSARRIA